MVVATDGLAQLGRLFAVVLGLAAGFVEAEEGGIGHFAIFSVGAGGLAQGICVGRGVEDVINDLKSEAEVFAGLSHHGDVFGGGISQADAHGEAGGDEG